MKKTELERRPAGANMTRSEQSAAVELAQLIDDAKRAQPKNVRQTGVETFTVDNRRSGLAGSTGWIDLRSLLPELLDAEGYLVKTPTATPAGEVISLEDAILANSRAMRAGARLLVAEPSLEPIEGAGVFRERTAGYRIISPASVDVVDLTDGEGEVVAQALPITEALIDPENWTQRACRFETTRAEMRDNPALVDELMVSIAAGLSHAADAELLAAISATGPGGFTMAAAAAAGCRFDQLRALTDGTGAEVGQDGALRLAGIQAELSPDLTGSLVGDWSSAALAVKPEIQVLVERTDATGGLAVTVWAGMQPLLPDASKFWAVS